MNIAIIIDKIWGANGGTEGQLLMLLEHIDQSKFTPHLVCLRDSEWISSAKLPCRATVLNVGTLLRPSFILQAWAFKRFLASEKIDLIQTYFDDAYIFGAIAGKMAGVPVMACRRNLGPAFWGKRGYLWTFRFIQKITSRYLVNSEATRDAIASSERIPLEKIKVIYNGLDLNRFQSMSGELRGAARQKLGVADDQLLVGMVSHLRREKNLELFVDSAERLRVQFPKARWIIVGDGWYRDLLEQYLRDRNLQSIMTLTGATDDIVPYLAAMDIAVLTSDGESFSNAIVEYLAAGLPAVATDVGGTVEALRENGFLFPAGDLEALTKILSQLLRNPQTRIEAGVKGRLEANQKYGISRMVSAHEEVYSEFLPKQVQSLIDVQK